MPIVQEREKTVSFFKYEVLEIDFLSEYPTNEDTKCCLIYIVCKSNQSKVITRLSVIWETKCRSNFCIGTKCRSSDLNEEFKLLLVGVELRGKDEYSARCAGYSSHKI